MVSHFTQSTFSHNPHMILHHLYLPKTKHKIDMLVGLLSEQERSALLALCTENMQIRCKRTQYFLCHSTKLENHSKIKIYKQLQQDKNS